MSCNLFEKGMVPPSAMIPKEHSEGFTCAEAPYGPSLLAEAKFQTENGVSENCLSVSNYVSNISGRSACLGDMHILHETSSRRRVWFL